VLHVDQRNYPDAMACARAAIRTDPKVANGHALLADVLWRSGDVSGCRAALTEAARLDPRFRTALARLPPLDVAPPPREAQR
jgi:cytochrome c-type biogenesis protein CcmH/NrfG